MAESGRKTREMTSLPDLPNDVIEAILSYVPAADLVKKCSLVNKTWNLIIQGQKLWREKCERLGIYSDKFPVIPKDFKKYYFHRPFSRNLIKNWDVRGNYL